MVVCGVIRERTSRAWRAGWADPLYTSATWNSYEYSRVCARDHQREVLYKERGENNGRPDP